MARGAAGHATCATPGCRLNGAELWDSQAVCKSCGAPLVRYGRRAA
jgi:hypothetical protein